MRALIVASVASMIDQFNMNNIRILKKLGYDVDVACNFESPGSITKEKCDNLKRMLLSFGVPYFQVDFSRNVYSFFNHIRALKQLKKIIIDNDYRLVHCHSPIGGMLTRIVCRKKRKQGLKVIYTAHGFHFYKGAPLKNWLIFYPIERKCSKWTDILITINKEDYEFAKKKMKSRAIEYVPGVGVDVKMFANTNIDIESKRKEFGVSKFALVILSVGELNKNKNHQIVIRALSRINDENIHYIIAGIGEEHENLYLLAKQLNVKIHLIGFRKDVGELYKMSDIFILPSIREGLNVSLMEAISSGCIVCASKIRGNCDLINENSGLLFNPKSISEVEKAIRKAIEYKNTKIVLNFDYFFANNYIEEKMIDIYQKVN